MSAAHFLWAALLSVGACTQQTTNKPGLGGVQDTNGNPDVVDADGDGYNVLDGDCDDTEASVHPGVTETCLTTWDDDCDGTTNATDVEGCVAWYIDKDGDGFGASEDVQCTCEPTDSYTADNTGDCDDADPHANTPDAPCRFEGDIPSTNADRQFRGMVEEAYAGWTVAFAGDTDGDGADDVLIGAINEGADDLKTGAVYIISSPLADGSGVENAQARIEGECPSCYLGMAASGLGDSDGDGYADIAIGEPGLAGEAILSVGAVLLFRGPLVGSLAAGRDENAKIVGDNGDTGDAVASAGDMDGDDLPDVLIGQGFKNTFDDHTGGALILSGLAEGVLAEPDALAIVDGESEGDYAGWALDGGHDLNGDGFADLAMGAPAADEGAAGGGAAFVVYGPIAGSFSLADADAKLLGEGTNDNAGRGLALAEDVDGDGRADLLVGAYQEGGSLDDTGAVYLVTSAPVGTHSLSDANAKLRGELGGGWAGYTVDGAGDLDKDGYGDFLVGAPVDNKAYLCYGPVAGSLSLADSDARFLRSDGALFGYDVAGGGDVDADGLLDILIGEPWASTDLFEPGAAWLFLGASYGR